MKIFLSLTLFFWLLVGVFAPQSSSLLPKNNGANDVELTEMSEFPVGQPDVPNSQSDGSEEESEAQINRFTAIGTEEDSVSRNCRDNPNFVSCARFKYHALSSDEGAACRQSPTLFRHLIAIQKTTVGNVKRQITLWAARNSYGDLPRKLLESYYVILEISKLETEFFKSMPQILPFQEAGGFPAVVDAGGDIENFQEISTSRRDPLVNADGTVNAFGKSVMAAVFRGNKAVRPLIALDLKNEAERVFEELVNVLRSETADDQHSIAISQLVQQFERRVLGNLNMSLRMLRLAKCKATDCSGFNPVPLLIAYLKWPNYPNERPVESQFVDDAVQSVLAVDVLTGGDNEYELTENTEFDSLISENISRSRSSGLAATFVECVAMPLSNLSGLGLLGSLFYAIFVDGFKTWTPAYLIAGFLAVGAVMEGTVYRINNYARQRRSTLTEFEREFIEENAPDEMDSELEGQILQLEPARTRG